MSESLSIPAKRLRSETVVANRHLHEFEQDKLELSGVRVSCTVVIVVIRLVRSGLALFVRLLTMVWLMSIVMMQL